MSNRTLAFAIVTLLAVALSGRTLWLIRETNRPMPFWDAWEFMRALPAIEGGRYTLGDLFAFHNEHRIVTTRLVMMADLSFVSATGALSTAVMVAVLCGIGALLACVTAGRGRGAACAAALAISLMLSTEQWENYVSGFQVQFPLVDLFAIASIGGFVGAQCARTPAGAWSLLAAALAFDALAIGSMASGNLVAIALLLVAIAMRTPPARAAAVLFPALAMSAAFAIHYPAPGNPPAHDPVGIVHFTLAYLGATLRAYPRAPVVLGAVLVALYAGMVGALVRRRLRGSLPDPVLVWLAGVACFTICCALVTAVGRLELGLETAISSRYSIQSLLFCGTVFLMLWRTAGGAPRASDLRLALSVAGLGLSAASTLAALPVAEWRARVADYDRVGSAFGSGVFSDAAIAAVYPRPEAVRPAIDYMARRGLGPFSTRFAAIYRPPLNAVAGRLDALPACSGAADAVQALGPGWTEIDGWIAEPRNPGEDGWVLAFDAGQHFLGYTRQSDERDDVAQVLKIVPTRLGYRVSLRRTAAAAGAGDPVTLVLVPGVPDEPCRLDVATTAPTVEP